LPPDFPVRGDNEVGDRIGELTAGYQTHREQQSAARRAQAPCGTRPRQLERFDKLTASRHDAASLLRVFMAASRGSHWRQDMLLRTLVTVRQSTPRAWIASCVVALTATVVGSCGAGTGGGDATGGGATTSTGSGGHSGGAGGTEPVQDAGMPDVMSMPDAGPTTTPLDPCATSACWNGRSFGACGATMHKENFGSGKYGVHRRLLMAPADVEIVVKAERTGGSWSPLLIVHDEQGTTVHDGVESHSTSTLTVAATTPEPDTVGVRIKTTTRMHLSVFLTGVSVVNSGFSDVLPTDAKYALGIDVACPALSPLTVRGVKLDAEQDLWVRTIARHVVADVPGSAAERIDKSAHVTWWALKEGVLNVNNALSYSNCSFPPDQHIGPLETCPDPNNAWQVGLSGVQAAYKTLDTVEKLALAVYPSKGLEDLLLEAAVTAGFGSGTAQGSAIATSTDRLRLSWLLRHGAIGFEAQYAPVYNQCFVQSKSWCFGTGWPSSASFAATQADAIQAIADLKSIFQTLTP